MGLGQFATAFEESLINQDILAELTDADLKELGLPLGATGRPLEPAEPPAELADRIEEWRGQIVVLNLWASWCGPCVREIPALSTIQERYGERGVRVNQINPEWVLTEGERLVQERQGNPPDWHQKIPPEWAPSGRLILPEEIAAAVLAQPPAPPPTAADLFEQPLAAAGLDRVADRNVVLVRHRVLRRKGLQPLPSGLVTPDEPEAGHERLEGSVCRREAHLDEIDLLGSQLSNE